MTTALRDLPRKMGRLAGSQLIQNAGALAFVQGVNYLVPLVTLPYLTRVLGPEEWGRVAWMQVILGYFTILTDWGFSWSGVRKISTLRDNRAALSECFFAGWAVQWLLCALALSVLCGLALCAPLFSSFRPYALFGAGAIVAGVLCPFWLLTGLERLREVALVQLVIRVGAVPLIFLFVTSPGDGPIVIAASALPGVVGGAAALFWMRGNLALDWHWPEWRTICTEFKESGTIFISRVSIVLYTSLTPTILGFMAGTIAVGNYILADKIRSAAQSLLAPIAQALFPRMSYLFAHDPAAAHSLLWRSGLLTVLIAGTASIGLFLFADPIILLAGGHDFLNAATLLRWLSPLPLVIVVSQIASVQILLSLRKYGEFNRVLLAVGVFGFLTSWIFIGLYQSKGAVWFMLVVEIAACGGMWAYAYPALKHACAYPSLKHK